MSAFYNDTRIKFLQRLASNIPRRIDKSVFLATSGAEAIEAALKFSKIHETGILL